MFRRSACSACLALLVAIGLALPVVRPADASFHRTFAHDAFQARWSRLDRPVAEGIQQRSWLWGPEPNSIGIYESYADSAGGERLVQYFDKSRMEINTLDGDPNDPWYVTNGRLPAEMITGRVQTGDAREFDTGNRARIAVVGDPDNAFPTYADLQSLLVGAGQDAPNRIGQHVTQVFTPDGVVDQAELASELDTEIVDYVVWGNGGANVPRAFHAFMQREGLIWNGSDYIMASPIVDPLYAYGYPITEPYWVRARVAGAEQWVMFQCFERRCLTYTPGNTGDFQVEAGNVGQHYWRWRYGTEPLASDRSSHWSAMTIGSLRDYRSPGTGELDRRVVQAREFNFGPNNAAVVRERQTHLNASLQRYWEPTGSRLILHGFRRQDGTLETYAPGVTYLQWPMAVGDTWSTTTTVRLGGVIQGQATWTFHVEGQETVTIGAGSFAAYRIAIERSGEMPVETIWFVPNVGVVQSQALEFTTPLERYAVH